MTCLTTIDLQRKKDLGERIAATTAYDALFAKLLDDQVDLILVGDSLGMVVQGKENTLDVAMEEMVYHTKCVHRVLKRAHLVSDMPFLSYQISEERAIENAGRLLKAGAQSVKLEGGEEIASLVKKLVCYGIPVMAHIGMTPQSLHRWGGYRVQGKDQGRRDQLLRDAKILEENGAYAVVLESIPQDLSQEISQNLKIPTIGIGAGPFCNGQILVIYDLLGMDSDFNPKFLRKYANLSKTIREALSTYVKEVREGNFPSDKESYHS